MARRGGGQGNKGRGSNRGSSSGKSNSKSNSKSGSGGSFGRGGGYSGGANSYSSRSYGGGRNTYSGGNNNPGNSRSGYTTSFSTDTSGYSSQASDHPWHRPPRGDENYYQTINDPNQALSLSDTIRLKSDLSTSIAGTIEGVKNRISDISNRLKDSLKIGTDKVGQTVSDIKSQVSEAATAWGLNAVDSLLSNEHIKNYIDKQTNYSDPFQPTQKQFEEGITGQPVANPTEMGKFLSKTIDSLTDKARDEQVSKLKGLSKLYGMATNESLNRQLDRGDLSKATQTFQNAMQTFRDHGGSFPTVGSTATNIASSLVGKDTAENLGSNLKNIGTNVSNFLNNRETTVAPANTSKLQSSNFNEATGVGTGSSRNENLQTMGGNATQARVDDFTAQGQADLTNLWASQDALNLNYQSELDRILGEQSKYDTTISQLETDKSNLETTLGQITEDRSAYNTRLQEIRDQQSAYDARISSLKSDRDLYDTELSKAGQTKAAFEADIANIMDYSKKLGNEYAVRETNPYVQQLLSSQKEYNTYIDKITGQRAQLHDQFTSATKDRATLDDYFNQTTSDLSSLEDYFNKTTTQRTNLDSYFDAATQGKKDLSDYLNQYTSAKQQHDKTLQASTIDYQQQIAAANRPGVEGVRANTALMTPYGSSRNRSARDAFGRKERLKRQQRQGLTIGNLSTTTGQNPINI